MADAHVAVFGSLNVDLVTRVRRFPAPGETVVAREFATFPGGKGANQAFACGRLGAAASMYGKVGDDLLAGTVLDSLGTAGVACEAVEVEAGVATGTAAIWVDDSGENAIAIAAGANGRVDEAYVDRHLDAILQASYLLVQLEVPLRPLAYLLERIRPGEGPRVILDPAPAAPLDGLPLEGRWMLTPNEHELTSLTGMPTASEAELRAASEALLERTGVEVVLTKAGERGVYMASRATFTAVPGFPANVVDTTAAGDAFNGALAASARRQAPGALDLRASASYANAAAALSVGRRGAQPSMPAADEVERFMEGARGDGRGRHPHAW